MPCGGCSDSRRYAFENLLDSISERKQDLLRGSGWIHEIYELDYQFDDGYDIGLLPVDQYEQYLSYYRTESWYHVTSGESVDEIITLIRGGKTEDIRSAILENSDSTLDLIHALRAERNQSIDLDYTCFADFTDIAASSAQFIASENCEVNGMSGLCYNFFQSLTGIPDSSNGQAITFFVDSETDFVLTEQIDYSAGALTLTKNTLTLEKTDVLPDEIKNLLDNII